MNVLGLFRNERNAITISAGDRLFREGDPGDAMYVVLEGELDIQRGGLLFETVGPGDLLGELALIDDGPRSADATARTSATLAAVSRERFAFLVQQTPFFALLVMRTLAERLRRANDRL